MNRQETIHLLEQFDLKPVRSLGQNFLIDPRIIELTCTSAGIGPQDAVIEIGPGLGSLTKQLARRAGRVLAVEIDQHLLPVLRQELASYDQVEVIQADALKIDFAALLADWPGPRRLAANLPYYITTSVLEKVLSERPDLASLTLMLQKEAAPRLSAVSGSKLYGPLAVQVALYGTVRRLATVPAASFYPRPHVDSVLLLLSRAAHSPLPGGRPWADFLHACFARRRKTLLNSLADAGWSVDQRRLAEAALGRIGLPSTIRPEQVEPAQYLALWQQLEPSISPG